MPTNKTKELSTLAILAKKKQAEELEDEEMTYFVHGLLDGTVTDVQAGAMMMAFHLKELSCGETEALMRAMMTSGSVMEWPGFWMAKIASFQSTGSAGNKAKLLLAPAMAACGLRFPIMSARGYDDVGGILSKLKSIPGFDGNKSTMEVECTLSEVGCCVVQFLPDIAPAERMIRDLAALTGTGNTTAFREACMVARAGALQLRATVTEISYGPGEWIKTEEDACGMAKRLTELSDKMGLRTKVLLTKVAWPVGLTVGPSLEVAEAIRCMNGDGPDDLQQLVCKLGGHILYETGMVNNPLEGQTLVNKRIKDGSVRQKFGDMLKAQGVHKDDVRSLLKRRKDGQLSSVLPVATRFAHLSSDDAGYIHMIDMTVLKKVTYDLTVIELPENKCPAGGIQLCVHIGSYLKKGDLWGKVHHNTRLSEHQVKALRNAITLKPDPPQFDSEIHIQELKNGSLRAAVASPPLENDQPFKGSDAAAHDKSTSEKVEENTEVPPISNNGKSDDDKGEVGDSKSLTSKVEDNNGGAEDSNSKAEDSNGRAEDSNSKAEDNNDRAENTKGKREDSKGKSEEDRGPNGETESEVPTGSLEDP